MNSDRWPQVKSILGALSDLQGRERLLRLNELCAGDPDLRKEVETLLTAGEEAGEFLNHVASPPSSLVTEEFTCTDLGLRIGPYRVISEIGSGGMGVVYQAVREDEFHKQVAIKVVKRGMDTSSILGRFRRERQILAGLNHPYVATVLDGGTTPDGRPYFVMEFVAGRPIDEYCDAHKLPLKSRLALFRMVCEAVQYAHQNLVVHRDLKPSNILVTEDGAPKLVDFGIAKILNADVSDATLNLTQPALRIMTPEYASPEQVRGEAITMATDVYSLGVVLYELLTGRRPHRLTTRSPLELAHTICEQEPERPSSAIFRAEEPSSGAPTRTAEDIGAARGVRPEQLRRGLAGDLDNIVLKAMQKDSRRRYASVQQFSEDLRRHLAGLPVIARKDTAAYRVAKFVRRNRTGVLAGAWIILALATTAVLTFTLRNAGRAGGFKAEDGVLALLASVDGEAWDPVLSRDGKMIAYVADSDGRADLYVARLAGGERVRLTNDETRESTPRFSPDGELIAFTRIDPQTRANEVWVIPALGGQAVRILTGASDPAWSPDGSRVAFIMRKDGAREALATAAGDGSDVRILFQSDAGYPGLRHPSWSPDGSEIVVVRHTGGVSGELWLAPVKGEPWRRLPGSAAGIFCNNPEFTPDGRQIVYDSNRAGTRSLWILSLGSGEIARLTTGPGPDYSPTLSRDGSIAFINTHQRLALILFNPKTGESRELLTYSDYLWAPAFSPDGRELAYSRAERDGAWHIWVAPVSGGESRRLTSGRLPELYPRFTADGAAILYNTWTAEKNRVWRVPRNGGPAVPLTPSDDDDQYADMSPDGRWLAFARTQNMGERIYIAPPDGAAPARPLTSGPSAMPRWSPDGQWIAFSPSRLLSSGGSGIFVTHPDGTQMRRLTESGGWPVWWPDGQSIAYLTMGPDGLPEIRTIDLHGGLSWPLRGPHFKTTNTPFDISHDGALIATTNIVQISSEIWLLNRKGQIGR